jgi:hypothetical protein
MARPGEIKSTDLPLSTLKVPYMLAALDRWRAAASGGLLPSEHAVNPLGLMEAAGYSGLIDVLRNPLDFQYRYFGARMAAAIGADYRGRRVSELDPGKYIGSLMVDYLNALNGREPVLTHLAMHLDAKRQWSYLRLLLPLSNGGEEADAIWAVTNYDADVISGDS